VFSKIVLALDGSDPSDRAIPFAQELAKQSGGRIDVVHVREIVGGRGGVHSVRVDEESSPHRCVRQRPRSRDRPDATGGAPRTSRGVVRHLCQRCDVDLWYAVG